MMKSKNETAETRREMSEFAVGGIARVRGADSFPLRPVLAKRRFNVRSGSRAAVPSVRGCARPVYPQRQKNRHLPKVSRRCEKRTFSTRSLCAQASSGASNPRSSNPIEPVNAPLSAISRRHCRRVSLRAEAIRRPSQEGRKQARQNAFAATLLSRAR